MRSGRDAPRVLVIDNYDSFTFNLVQALWRLSAEVIVHRSDAIDLDTAERIAPDALLLSPGPGRPEGAGITLDAIRHFAGRVPILGVCLGHQAIGVAHGARVVRAPRLMHGRTSEVLHDGRGVFAGLGSPVIAARYHSLVIDPSTLPPDLEPTAWTDRRELMAMRHRTLDIEGVQFHPESFLTPDGARMLANFVARACS
jgi:anthranilate synthase/aminodeoxychorismate synthase-like glutamine amidotransferase